MWPFWCPGHHAQQHCAAQRGNGSQGQTHRGGAQRHTPGKTWGYPGAYQQQPEANQRFVQVEVHREGYGIRGQARGGDGAAVMEAWQPVQGQRQRQQHKQGVPGITQVMAFALQNGKPADSQQGQRDQGLNTQLPVAQGKAVAQG